MIQRNQGFTLLELIVVMAILGILFGLSGSLFRTPTSRTFSNELRSQIQQARYEALKRNRPVSVIWTGLGFETRWHSTNPSIASACAGDKVLRAKRLSDSPDVTVTSGFTVGNGVVWLPSGQGRKCDGTSLEAKQITVKNSRKTYSLSVSVTGRVTTE